MLRLAAISCLILLTLTVFSISWRVSERSRIEEVASPTPDWIPVLAFTQDNVDIVWYGELAGYKKTHPDYSFLAPEGQEELLNKKLLASYRKKVPSADGFPEFEVKQLSPGRQALKLGLYGDGDTVVWYEATAHEFFPRRHLATGPLLSLISLFWSVAVTTVFWGFVYGSWRIIREARRSTG